MYTVSLSYLCIVASLMAWLLVFHDAPETYHKTLPPAVWFALWYTPQLVMVAPYFVSEWYATASISDTASFSFMCVILSYLSITQCAMWYHRVKLTEYIHSYVGVVSIVFLPCCLFVAIDRPLDGESWWWCTWHAPVIAVPVFTIARWRRFRLYKLQQKSV